MATCLPLKKFEEYSYDNHIGAKTWHNQPKNLFFSSVRAKVECSKSLDLFARSQTTQPPATRPQVLRIATNGQQVALLEGDITPLQSCSRCRLNLPHTTLLVQHVWHHAMGTLLRIESDAPVFTTYHTQLMLIYWKSLTGRNADQHIINPIIYDKNYTTCTLKGFQSTNAPAFLIYPRRSLQMLCLN